MSIENRASVYTKKNIGTVTTEKIRKQKSYTQKENIMRFIRTMPYLILVNILMGCLQVPEKNIYSEIIIEANVRDVWNVLKDIDNYPSWNPYHTKVSGVLEQDSVLSVEIHKPNGDSVFIEPHVLKIIPEKELTWGGGLKGVFIGEHTFLLKAINENRTHLIHKETFSGIAIPFASLEAIQEGYELMNKALKDLLEK